MSKEDGGKTGGIYTDEANKWYVVKVGNRAGGFGRTVLAYYRYGVRYAFVKIVRLTELVASASTECGTAPVFSIFSASTTITSTI